MVLRDEDRVPIPAAPALVSRPGQKLVQVFPVTDSTEVHEATLVIPLRSRQLKANLPADYPGQKLDAD